MSETPAAGVVVALFGQRSGRYLIMSMAAGTPVPWPGTPWVLLGDPFEVIAAVHRQITARMLALAPDGRRVRVPAQQVTAAVLGGATPLSQQSVSRYLNRSSFPDLPPSSWSRLVAAWFDVDSALLGLLPRRCRVRIDEHGPEPVGRPAATAQSEQAALAAFVDALREAHAAAGAPSTRMIRDAIGWSHTHIAVTLNGTVLPSRDVVVDLARYLDADPGPLLALHEAARRTRERAQPGRRRRGGRG